MIDFTGWFVAGSVAWTLVKIKAIPDLKMQPKPEEVIQSIFEARNVCVTLDDKTKLYPVFKEEKRENLVHVFTRWFKSRRCRENLALDRVPTEPKGFNESEGKSRVATVPGTAALKGVQLSAH